MYVGLALLSSLLWGSADFFGGTLSRRLPAPVVVAASQAFGLALVTILAAVLGELTAPLDYVPWAVAAGLSGMAGLLCFYAALAAGTMGVVSPIAALGVAVPVVVGLVRGESPAPLQLVGIGVAIGGVVLASGPELSGRAGVRPLVLAAVAAVGFGLALLFIAGGSESSPLMTLVGMRLTSVSVLAVLLRRTLAHHAGAVSLPTVAAIALVGFGDVLANLAFGIASTGGLVSVIAVLGSLYPVATVLLARAVHAERLGRLQQIGVGAALAGVVLIGAAG